MKTTIDTYQKNVTFTDATGQTVFVEIEITDDRFSMSGNITGHGSGQILDQIKPADQAQTDLVNIWRAYHLNDMHAGTIEQEAALASEDFKAFKLKAYEIVKQAQVIKKIITGSFADYCEFIGIKKKGQSKWSAPISVRADFEGLQAIWYGKSPGKDPRGSLLPVRNWNDYIQRIPAAHRPKFTIATGVPPAKVIEMFGDNYSISCAYLESKVLLTVKHPETGEPYKYGHAWLKRELPADIIDQVEAIVSKFETFTGSGYQKQANDLLAKFGIKFSAVFQRHDLHFVGDEHTRDIFTCRLQRGKDYFTLSFGQSTSNSDSKGSIPPTAYDLLACLTKSDPGSFEDFCSNYGYDTARKIYRYVVNEWRKVDGFFTDEEITELQNIA